MPNYSSALLSDVGPVRSNNEDRTYAPPNSVDAAMIEARGRLFIVADGMGGYAAGEVAAQIAVDTISEHFYGGEAGDNLAELNVADGLREAITAAQEAISAEQARDPEKAQMGCAIVMAVIRGDEVTIANVGDCRAYGLLSGAWKQLSHDHSWVAEQVAAEIITQEQAVHHPMRSALTRALGQASVSSEPAVNVFHWNGGDRLMMCSDGLWDTLTEDQLFKLSQKPPQQAVTELIQQAIQMRTQDNVTACVVINDDPKPDKTMQLSALLPAKTAPARAARPPMWLVGLLGLLLVGLVAFAGWGILRPQAPLSQPGPTAMADASTGGPANAVTPREATSFPTSAPPTNLPTVALPTVTVAPATATPASGLSNPTNTPAPPTAVPTRTPVLPANVEPTPSQATPPAQISAAARVQPASEIWLCNLKDATPEGCTSDMRTSLDPLSSTIHASWSPGLTTGKDFDVSWKRYERATPVIIWLYRCTWSAAGQAHSCATVPPDSRRALPTGMNNFVTNGTAIFSNGDKTGDGISPGWGVKGFLAGRYRFELQPKGSNPAGIDFEIKR